MTLSRRIRKLETHPKTVAWIEAERMENLALTASKKLDDGTAVEELTDEELWAFCVYEEYFSGVAWNKIPEDVLENICQNVKPPTATTADLRDRYPARVAPYGEDGFRRWISENVKRKG